MERYELENLPVREPTPGFRGKFVHTENMTVAYWNIAAGSAMKPHSHPHEQVTLVLAGEFEMEIGGAKHHLRKGSVLLIPPSEAHGGRALQDCVLLDVFHPVREDLRAMS